MRSSSDSDYTNSTKLRTRPKKRRKLNKYQNKQNSVFIFPLDAVLNASQEEEDGDEDRVCFEDIIDPWLEELSRARREWELGHSDLDGLGNNIRPLRPHEAVSSAQELDALSKQSLTPSQALLLRKLKVQSFINVSGLNERNIHAPDTTLTPLEKRLPTLLNADVIDALHSIQTTPFQCSFLSRLQGKVSQLPLGLIAVDWETRTPWMELMADIRDHFSLAHPERDQPKEDLAPIAYCKLQSTHLPQVHDLLERSFWAGIDVTDSLDYQPEKATVLAVYKKVVVGVAILKSPQETYIMYLAVKAGWDKSQIARTMLYHLITMNPQKDITLHVSTNSSAMLLYNQFGFKAEEFVAGFYSKYLDPQSRLSTNAFKLRLRHLQN